MAESNPDELNETLKRVLTRLDSIEARLTTIESGRRAAESVLLPREPPTSPQAPIAEDVFVPVSPAPVLSVPGPTEEPSLHLETQVGLTWLNRIGVLTVVLGVAFFFRYAIDKGLIGETGRVILGVLAAFAALGAAEFLWRRDHRIYAQGITGAGIGILYLSLYSAFGFYHLLPLLTVFFLMFLTTVGTVALALRYGSIATAALGLVGGYLTPLLLNTSDDRPWALFGYILLLQAGGMALVNRKRWLHLEPLLVVGTALVYLVWFASRFAPGKEIPATFAPLAFYAVFWVFGQRYILVAAHALTILAIAATWPGPDPQAVGLNLLLASAGLLASQRRAWPELSIGITGLFYFSALIWRGSRFTDLPVLGLIALTAAFGLFFIHVMLRFNSDDEPLPPGAAAPYLGILAINGPLYFAICCSLLQEQYHEFLGSFTATLAAAHLFAAWQLAGSLPAPVSSSAAEQGEITEAQRPIFLAVGMAVAFVTLAIPIQFSQYRITMSWAIEAAAFTWIAARTGYRRFGVAALIVFGLTASRLLIFDGPMYADRPMFAAPGATAHALIFNARFFTFLIATACYWLASRWMKKGPPALVLYVAGHFSLLFALMAETLDWAGQRTSMGDPASLGMVSASVLLAVYGIALVATGITARSFINRVLGLGLLALVILKLYLFDVWQLDQTFRIVSFVALGLLLLAVSFLYSRFRALLEKLWAAE